MDMLTKLVDFMALASNLLLFLLSTNRAMELLNLKDYEDNNGEPSLSLVDPLDSSVARESMMRATLHSFAYAMFFFFLDEELSY